MRKYLRYKARKELRKIPELWNLINDYLRKTGSTGISWVDIHELYKSVRSARPKSVLELGQGSSTLVIAFALRENEKEGYPGKITAMEELEEYLVMGRDLLGEEFRPYVNYVLCPRVDFTYEIFRGVRYSEVPNIDFDFIFVDGPMHTSPTDGQFCYDADLIYILQRPIQSSPISGLVDFRLSSSYVFQKLLGKENVKFNMLKELAFLDSVESKDLKRLTLEGNIEMLKKYGHPFRNSILKLYQ
tara:strand:- start:275 stop:1006 length:732 start_codon:yes stop_codon:yes gene_type:complete